MGDETHERRSREHAEVADGRHRRHGEAQGHKFLAGRSGEKHGHDVRDAETDHRKPGERSPCPRSGDHQPEPGGGAQAAVQENAGIAERLHNAVPKQAPDSHGYGETREGQTCAGGFRTALGGHEQRAPVQNGALTQIHDETQHPDQEHDTARNHKQRGFALAPVGQEMPPERRQQRDHEQANDEHGQMRR